MDEVQAETLKVLLRNNAALMRQYLAALDKLETRVELLEDKVMLLEAAFAHLRGEALEHGV